MEYLEAWFQAHKPWSVYLAVAFGWAVAQFIIKPLLERIARS